MILRIIVFFALLQSAVLTAAAPKPHVLTFGKWTTVQWHAESGSPLMLKVRGLYLDDRLKEFTFGLPHEITDHLFVVRRAFRVNDALPQEAAVAPRWEWQPGGWLLVDRVTGHVSQIALPEFDPYYSAASWYRDYIAYCGISDDGKKLSAVVTQLGHRKALLKKALGETKQESMGADCPTPTWQRRPARVTFYAGEIQAATYAVHGHAAEAVIEQTPGDEEAEDKATE